MGEWIPIVVPIITPNSSLHNPFPLSLPRTRQEKEDREVHTDPPASGGPKGSTYGFFDFHAALASFWCCTTELERDQGMISLAATPALEEAWVSSWHFRKLLVSLKLP